MLNLTCKSYYNCSQDGEFVTLLREYVENGIEGDYKTVASGKEELQQLTQLLGSAMRDLDKCVLFVFFFNF